MRQLRMILGAAAVAALIAPAASGQTWNVNKVTYLTFSGPVQVPGASLPAGTYMFRLADPLSHRQVIQIRDKDGGQIFTTLVSIPNHTAQPKDDPFVMFLEATAGQPAAIKAWFYPGEKTGYEFVYPKDQAMRIASYTKSPVLAHADNVTSASDVVSDSKVGRVDAQGQFVEEDKSATSTTTSAEPAATSPATTTADAQPAPAPAPSANRTESQVAVGTAGQRDSTTAGRNDAAATAGQGNAGASRAKQLPRTGSDLGLVQLLSALSLVGALGLQQRRKYAAATRA